MRVQVQRALACSVAAAALVAVGFLGGRWTAPVSAPTAPVPFAETEARSPSPPSVAAPVREAPGPTAPAELPLVENEAGGAPTAVNLEPVLSAARAMRDSVDAEEAAAVARQATDELYVRLAEDGSALATALARFKTLQDEHELGLLASVLGRLADPEVEQAALDMIERGDAAQRAAAFDVLDGLNVPSARPAALASLGREGDVNVRRAALRAIPEPLGASLEEAGTVRVSLERVLSRDPDPEARRRAAIVLARHATNAAELRPVLDALLRDPDANVRAGCAFACESAGIRDAAVLEALARALDPGQEQPVREAAWNALRHLSPLPPAPHAAFVAFGEERTERGEELAD